MKKLITIAILSLMGNFSLFAGEGGIMELNKDTYQNIVNTSKYLVVDVYAEWCGPCKLLAPVLKALNEDFGHLYQFAKLEATEANQALIQSLDVKGLPTVIFYQNGKEIGRTTGFSNADAIKQALKEHFPEKK
jgi:thioredoxin 1